MLRQASRADNNIIQICWWRLSLVYCQPGTLSSPKALYIGSGYAVPFLGSSGERPFLLGHIGVTKGLLDETQCGYYIQLAIYPFYSMSWVAYLAQELPHWGFELEEELIMLFSHNLCGNDTFADGTLCTLRTLRTFRAPAHPGNNGVDRAWLKSW